MCEYTYFAVKQIVMIDKKSIKLTCLGMLSLVIAFGSCRSHYEIANIERSRILVDSRYDSNPDAAAAALLAPYKQKVDSVMGPKVGRSARYMTAQRPEGTLSNLLADIMVWAGKDYGEKPEFGIYNMGGVRADLPKGDITYGDVLNVAPFENKIAFLTLSGSDVLSLFGEIAAVGGEGVSHSVRLVITKDGKLVSATINGEPVDPQRDYRVTTIDYLLGGTDKMTTFKRARDINSPQEVKNNSRFVIMNYFRKMDKQGIVVDSEIEGRVTVAGSALNDK